MVEDSYSILNILVACIYSGNAGLSVIKGRDLNGEDLYSGYKDRTSQVMLKGLEEII